MAIDGRFGERRNSAGFRTESDHPTLRETVEWAIKILPSFLPSVLPSFHVNTDRLWRASSGTDADLR